MVIATRTGTIEDVIGANIGIYDFIRGGSGQDTRTTVREATKFVFDDRVLKDLIKNQEYDLVSDHVLGAVERRELDKVLGFFTTCYGGGSTYYDNAVSFSSLGMDGFKPFIELVLEEADRVEQQKGSNHDLYQYSRMGLRKDLVELGDNELTDRVADSVFKAGYDDEAFRFFEHTNNREKMQEILVNYFEKRHYTSLKGHLMLDDNVLKIDEETAKKTLDEIAKRATNHQFLSCDHEHLQLADIINIAKKINYTEPFERLADSKMSGLSDYDNFEAGITITFYNAITNKENRESVSKKLSSIARICLDNFDLKNFDRAYESANPKTIGKEDFIEVGDRLVRKELDEYKREMTPAETRIHLCNKSQPFYERAKLDDSGINRRIFSILKEQKRHKPALEVLLREKDYQGAFDYTIEEIAKAGDTGQALSMLQEITSKTGRSNRIDTDRPEFYQTIASSVFSLCLLNPSYDPENMQKLFNSKIMNRPVKNLSITRGNGTYSIEIDFGKTKVVYEQEKVDKLTRNNVKSFRQRGLNAKDSFIKFYDSRQNALSEAHWLKRLEGQEGCPKLVSSERFGKVYLNQIETVEGDDLDTSFRTMPYEKKKEVVKQALELWVKNAKHLQKDEQQYKKDMRRQTLGFRYKGWTDIDGFGCKYIDDRVDDFHRTLRALKDDERVNQLDRTFLLEYLMPTNFNFNEILPFRKKCIKETLNWYQGGDRIPKRDMTPDIIGHWDFAPRNLRLKDRDVITLDHEVYKRCRSAQGFISLVHNPEIDLNERDYNEMKEWYVELCRENGISERPASEYDGLMPQTLINFWDMREARHLAHEILEGTATEQTIRDYNWYLADMREMQLKTQKRARPVYERLKNTEDLKAVFFGHYGRRKGERRVIQMIEDPERDAKDHRIIMRLEDEKGDVDYHFIHPEHQNKYAKHMNEKYMKKAV